MTLNSIADVPAATQNSVDESRPGVLKGQRVLVTGGAGFIGSHIVDQLLAAGCAEILVVDNMIRGRRENLAGALLSGKVKLVVGNYADRELLRSVVDGTDTVFHQAALRITQCAAEPRAALDVMVNATFDLFEMCAHARVRKVVMASSASIYGMASDFPTPEHHHPYANNTLYGAAKMFAEGVLRSFSDMFGLNYVALRYFNVYGPRMDIHGRYTEVLIRWMDRIVAGQHPIIFGDGQQTMDMVHVIDVARANILAASSPSSDVALNIGTGTETSLLELAHMLSQMLGRPDLGPIFQAERAVNAVARRLADTTAARESIGFTATIPLAEGMRGLVGWWRNNKDQNASMEAAQ